MNTQVANIGPTVEQTILALLPILAAGSAVSNPAIGVAITAIDTAVNIFTANRMSAQQLSQLVRGIIAGVGINQDQIDAYVKSKSMDPAP